MIHVFMGTKAQFIKMAPIIQELDRRGIVYNFVDAGQHGRLTGDLVQQFGLRRPNVFLRDKRTNIDTVSQAIGWTIRILGQLMLGRKQTCRRVFQNRDGICLIHGDTLTTLIALLYAKRCGLKVAHIEAGLRSYHLFQPFPEEIIRLIAMRYSDLLFAPSAWAYENLCRMGYRAKTLDVGGNTGLDAVRYAITCANGQIRPRERYVIVTTHRVETIYSRSRLTMIVALLERIACEYKVLFVLHEPTRRQLLRFNLYGAIQQNEAIQILPLQPYLTFVNLMAGAEFVVTDGGSIQEETYFLNIPCLVMRSKTERVEGLGENACLAEFDPEQIERFFQRLPTLRRQNKDDDQYPSEVVVDHIVSWA